MKLDLNVSLAAGYKSSPQIARVVTENWASQNLFCPACPSNSLRQFPTNTRAVDFLCPNCNRAFQLKSSRTWNQHKIIDSAYSSMIAAIRSDSVPNLMVMQYTPQWKVQNLLFVPSFFFTETSIEKRNPLSPSARRAGWVGCNILLREIPPDGKLILVADGILIPRELVRERFNLIKPLSMLKANVRGWTLSVLNIVRLVGKSEFSLFDIYEFEEKLTEKYPRNQNVRPKIRQQLQKLRDFGLLEFLGQGRYRVISVK